MDRKRFYWAVAGIALLVVAGLFWVRHTDSSGDGRQESTPLVLVWDSEPESLPESDAALESAPADSHGREAQAPSERVPEGGVVHGVVYSIEGERAGSVPVTLSPLVPGGMVNAQAGGHGLEEPPLLHATDSTGGFRFERVPYGFHLLGAQADGQAAHSVARVTAEAPVYEADLVLRAAAAISGRVETPDRLPVASAQVTPVSRNDSPTRWTSAGGIDHVQTDADGAFTLEPLRAGEWVVFVSSEAHGTTLSPPIATGGPPIVITLGRTAALRGRAVTRPYRQPASGLKLRIAHERISRLGFEAVTGASGEFTVEGLPRTVYQITADDDARVLAPAVYAVDLSRDDATITLEVDDGGIIRGRAFVADTGAPLAGALVIARSRATGPAINREARADASGHYEIIGAPPGRVDVGLDLREGYAGARAQAQVTIEAGEIVEGVNLSIEYGVSIAGSVVDVKGAPVGGARVYALGTAAELDHAPVWSSHAVTNSEGRFRIPRIDTGLDIYLQARTLRAISREQGPYAVPAEGLDGVVIVLDQDADALVAGAVVDNSGRPARAYVSLRPVEPDGIAADRGQSASTEESDGRFVITGLMPGAYQISIGHSDGSGFNTATRPVQRVTLQPGQALRGLRLVLETDERRTIQGTVTDAQGRPLRGVEVHAETFGPDGDPYHRIAMTDPNGHYVLRDLDEAREYRIWAEGERQLVTGAGHPVDFVIPNPSGAGE